MKILQSPVRLYTTGGVESYVRNLSKELVIMGHDVRVICADSPGKEVVDKRVSVKAMRTFINIANTNITPALPLALLRSDFDILHTHLPTPWSADWSALVSRFRERPLVLTYHNDIMGDGDAKYIAWLYNRTALKLLLKSADRIIMARESYLSPFLGDYRDKISVIPVGIDVMAFRPLEVPQKGDIFFLSILDKYHSYKGLEHLFKALKILKREQPNVKLVVGGSGSMIKYYLKLADSLGLKRNVRFVGHISKNQLLEYYNGCRLFVLPSTDPAREGFGMVLLEAMACSRPVITTDIAGMARDIKKNAAGLVVSRGNEEELADAMGCVLKEKDLAFRMGTFGRKLVEEKYSWNVVAKRIERVYKDLLG